MSGRALTPRARALYTRPMSNPAPQGLDAAAELHRRIGEHGPVTFAEFMAVALYWPHGGYYASREATGPAGDFYTAPLTHPVFGALIARQLGQMGRLMGSPAPFRVVEPGAGGGRLAADVVRHAGALDAGFAAALDYVGVDLRAHDSVGGGVGWLKLNG